MTPRAGRMGVALAVTLAATALVPATADSAKRHGVQRGYAGAAWSSGEVGGFYATLRLDRALTADRRTGGFIGQTFWVATNEATTRFGRNKRTPYVQVSLSRGYRGRNVLAHVLSQRNKNGRYYETKSRRVPARQQEEYHYSILFQVGGIAEISILRPGGSLVATAKNTGKGLGGRSAYAGIESSSRANQAGGAVGGLGFRAIVGGGSAAVPRWKVGGGDRFGAELIARGPGRVTWRDKYESFWNSYGR